MNELALRPLTRDGTAEQLALLSGGLPDPASVDRIYLRSQGQPLFTEQLAAQADGQPMPQLLADLLDRRLDGLGREAWCLARALGVADRALDDGLLTDITGLDGGDLAAGLHELGKPPPAAPLERGTGSSWDTPSRRKPSGDASSPRSPSAEHRRIAEALGRSADPSAAEVAEHWQRAEDPGEEIVWRIRAARSAEERFALVQAGAQWRRVLDLWPSVDEMAGVTSGPEGLRPTSRRWTRWPTSTWRPPGKWPRRACATGRMSRGADAAEIYSGPPTSRDGWATPKVGWSSSTGRSPCTNRPRPRSATSVRSTNARCCWTALGRYDEARAPRHAPWRRAPTSTRPNSSGRSSSSRPTATPAWVTWTAGWPASMPPPRVEMTTPDPEGDITWPSPAPTS